jgi:hypothetical protein
MFYVEYCKGSPLSPTAKTRHKKIPVRSLKDAATLQTPTAVELDDIIFQLKERHAALLSKVSNKTVS